MASLSLELLGGFELRRDSGTPVALRAKKAKALLAYLALHSDREHSRDRLAALLWSDSDKEHGRHNLRQALLALRNALSDLAEGVLRVGGEAVLLDGAAVDVDAVAFERLAREATFDSLSQAVTLYRGDLCAGLELEARAYQEWLEAERARFRELVIAALTKLLDALEARGAVEQGIEATLRLLEIDSLQESAHRALMRLYARQGRREAALHQFELCRRTLKRDLDVEPETATKELYFAILRDRSAAPEGTSQPRATESAGGEAPGLGHPGAEQPAGDGNGSAVARPAPNGFPVRWRVGALAAVALAGLAGAALWRYAEQGGHGPNVTVQSDKLDILPIIKGPSIAVLPFRNLSGEAEQRYFGEGLAEDIITDLSKVSGLVVISSNSSFALSENSVIGGEGFRGLVNATAIAETLNVRYLLQGSIRRAGELVRLNVRLLDSTTGQNIWSERYDRAVTDIFAVQDDITQKIVAELKATFTDLEYTRAAKNYTADIAAYDFYLRGRRLQSDVTRDINQEAKRLLEKAIELDPSFAAAYAELSLVLWESWFFNWSDDADAVKRQAWDMAMKAASLDDGLPEVHTYLSWTYLWSGAFEEAVTHGRRAIEINPNYANGYLYLSHVLTYSGEPAEGIRVGLRGMPLDPYSAYHFLYHIADGYWLIGDYDNAIESLNEAIRQRPNFVLSHAMLARIYAELDRLDEARAAAAEVVRINPNFTAGIWRNLGYKDRSIARRIVDGLRKAGLQVPDEPEAS